MVESDGYVFFPYTAIEVIGKIKAIVEFMLSYRFLMGFLSIMSVL